MADALLALLAQGCTMTQACKEVSIGRTSVHRWRAADTTFDRAVEQALGEGYEALADRLLDIPNEERDRDRAKLLSENLKWLLSKRARNRYGDSLDLNVKQQIDLRGALAAANERIAKARGEVIDAEVVQEPAPAGIKLEDLF